MKLGLLTSFFAMSVKATTVMHQSDVARTLTGSWVSTMFEGRHRRDIDGRKGFKPLAAMMMYLQGFGANGDAPTSHNDFNTELEKLEARFVNYGCYCWINGLEEGVIGGGKTKDMVDHHCKELYRCYKCVQSDYQANYTDISYSVDFNRKNNERNLDCQVNSKQDSENICECDKRFAMNIAQADKDCDAGVSADTDFGEHCMDEQYRTKNGNGNFEPQTMCNKQFHGHDKEKCCGIYPNRYPYDINFSDCCQSPGADGNGKSVSVFSVLKTGDCGPAGGTVVVSEPGNPHSYVAVNGGR